MSPRRRLSDARRLQILEAAARVIVQRGVADTRISDIAEIAGTSSALVLYYFDSKDRLLAEALTASEERFYEDTEAELETIESARDRLIRLIDLSCSDGGGNGLGLDEYLLWLDLWARAPRDPVVAKNREALDRRWRTTIADIVRDGEARGEFTRIDPDDFALRLAALLDGLAVLVVLHDPEVDVDRMRTICLRTAAEELGFELPSAKGRQRTATRTAAKAAR
jgi:AcrR family transcriptional regulator